ncbi:MAG TPA: PH domain-containing protein [Humisphaera sp.]
MSTPSRRPDEPTESEGNTPGTDALPRLEEPTVFPAAAPGAAAVRDKRPLAPALAALLTGHVLRDGEVILLVLRPSLWYVVLTSLKFAAAMAIVATASKLWLPENAAWYYVEAAMFLVVGRLMWALLNWVGRLYVLTDQRVLRLSGVFAVEIFDCPLRKVAHTRVTRTVRERVLRLGSIEIFPADDGLAPGVWQTVRRPREVRDAIQAAIRKAKNRGGGPMAA